MSLARHLILCLVIVQPRKTGKCPDMTEKLFTGTYIIHVYPNIKEYTYIMYMKKIKVTIILYQTKLLVDSHCAVIHLMLYANTGMSLIFV